MYNSVMPKRIKAGPVGFPNIKPNGFTNCFLLVIPFLL